MLHSICQQICKTQQWPQDGKRSIFIPIPRKGNAKECSNYCTIALISHASKVMLKILQVRLQQYMNCELPDVQLVLEKAEEPEIKLPTSAGSLKQHFCFIDYAKAFECVDHNKLWKILQEMGIPEHMTFLLRNLYAGQVATVRTGHRTTDWFQIGKGVRQGCILSPSYLTYRQRTSRETLGWKKHRLESRLPGEISVTSDMQMIPTLWQKVKN